MKRTLCAVGLVAVLFAVVATPARADKCTGAKLKAIGKKEGRLLSCSAKEATKGTVGVEPDCNNEAITKFSSSYDKPGVCGDPPSADCELYRTRFLGHQDRLTEIRDDRPIRDARRAR